LPVQAKLLRLIQEREILPVGADETIALRARVMAATHRDLAALIESGTFREDLYYRLNVVPIALPPLRERRGDVALLLDHFLAAANRAQGREVDGFSPEVVEILSAYPWPGNVRELANLVERLVAMKESGPVETVDLPPELRSAPRPLSAPVAAGLPFETARRAFEREFFARLLHETRGNVSEAARRAGISRPNLYRRLKETGLDPADFKKG
jgi:DNA-binding NtrC family response regulator